MKNSPLQPFLPLMMITFQIQIVLIQILVEIKGTGG
jgi:hypothetical protein